MWPGGRAWVAKNSPFWSAASHAVATQHVMPLMNPLSEQMHLGSRLHELGMALRVQFCCAEEEQDSHQPKMALLDSPILLGEAASDAGGRGGGEEGGKKKAHRALRKGG